MTDGAQRDLSRAAAPVAPSPRQLQWRRTEFHAFIHYTFNAFTGRQWGDGREDPAIFNPTAFDAGQWAAVCKSAGMRGLLLTCKHHDGFCLWPSAATDHSVVGCKRLLGFNPVPSDCIQIEILASRLCPTLSRVGSYHADLPQ